MDIFPYAPARAMIRKALWALAGLVLLGLLGLFLLGSGQSLTDEAAAQPNAALAKQGEYLAAAGDCVACHTAKGGQDFAGGRPLPTPFGTIYSANITPDPAHGIGGWSANAFHRALTEGVSADGSHIYPACPYSSFAITTAGDSAAIQSYLLTQTPVAKAPPAHDLPFPFTIRAGLGYWKLFFFDGGKAARARAEQTPDTLKRGQYLVDGLGHCAGCHAPINFAGAYADATAMTGGARPELAANGAVHDSYAPSIINGAAGLAAWSRDDIAHFLKVGRTDGKGSAVGAMAEVITKSTQYLTKADRLAMADYLLSLHGTKQPAPKPLPAATSATGAALYRQNCAACHGDDGEGRGLAFAGLAKTPVANSADPASLIYITLYGGRGAVTQHSEWAPAMPPFEAALSDRDVAALLSYVRASWGNVGGPVTADQVAKMRKDGASHAPQTGPAQPKPPRPGPPAQGTKK